MRNGIIVGFLFGVVLLAGCGQTGGGGGGPSVGPLTQLVIGPTNEAISIAAGSTLLFEVQARDDAGKVISTPTDLQWQVVGGIGTIEAVGRFHAQTAATGKVRVVWGQVSAEVPVTVVAGVVTGLVIVPGHVHTTVGATVTLEARGYDEFDNAVIVSPEWRVVDGPGTINSDGRFSSGTTGTATIRARYNGRVASATIVVAERVITGSYELAFTIGGLGSGEAQFRNPGVIAIDRTSDTAFVFDSGNLRVQIFNSSGRYLATSSLTDRISGQIFGAPSTDSLAVREGDGFYFLDGDRAYQFDASGRFLRKLWLSVRGWGSGIAYDQSSDQLVAIDARNIYRYQPDSTLDSNVEFTNSPFGSSPSPLRLAVDPSGAVLVHSQGSVYRLSSSGAFTRAWSAPGIDQQSFLFPGQMTTDGSGNVYIADYNGAKKFDRDGNLTALIGGKTGAREGEFSLPSGVAVDSRGYVWISDTGNHRIQVFRPVSGVSNPGVPHTPTQPDTTPPQVISTVPVNGATNVPLSLSGPITVTFNEAMDDSTISYGNFTLLRDGAQVYSDYPSYDSVSRTASIYPPHLSDGSTYTLVVSTGVKDAAGNPLAEPYRLTFTVTVGTKI